MKRKFRCVECKKIKKTVRLIEDPYEADVNNRIIKRRLCKKCEVKLAEEI